MDKKHIKNLIENHYLRLQVLKEQQALQGFSVDPKIPVEIRIIETRIAGLQLELAALPDETPPEKFPSIKIEPPSFKTGGALTGEDAGVYIEREADDEAGNHVQKMNYLLIVEPRQQGKTSLICQAMLRPTIGEIAWVYIDMTTLDTTSEKGWYETLCSRILAQLSKFISPHQWPDIPQTGPAWRNFLCEVAHAATTARGQVIIALDEIGAVEFPGATTFFSVLRDIYNSRQAEPYLKQLTFWLVGAFRPQELIEDDRISPFNVAQRVYLADFTPDQVQELVSKGGWPYEQVRALAERIHSWTDGQPYLTQLLCSYLGPEATPADVDAGVQRLRREDRNHLAPLLKRFNKDQKLQAYVAKIQAGTQIQFFPGENRRHAQLELLGLVKANRAGYCVIRNRIYEAVLKDVLDR